MSKARDIANSGTALGSVSPTELGYLDGVTSAVQTQINAKLATSTAASTYEPALPSQSGNSGKYLTTNGSSKSWGTLTIPDAVSLQEEVFTSSGSWTAPTGVTKVQLVIVGGGGAGGGTPSGSGGQGGAYKTVQSTVTPGTTYTVTVGSGGAGNGGWWSGGGPGSASSFDTISASGGGGGVALNYGNFPGESAYGPGAGNNGASAGSNYGAGGGGSGGGTSGNGGSGIVIVRWLA